MYKHLWYIDGRNNSESIKLYDYISNREQLEEEKKSIKINRKRVYRLLKILNLIKGNSIRNKIDGTVYNIHMMQ
ncbi:MAG: hypothetical protein KatS3mg003_1289 [Candidatus Nitrosocaldaceae archaeon]|nr:MAG: hypothetical protein KatS3mg003_1289 [Candidatus Nitrosocaldaceae archaeon]